MPFRFPLETILRFRTSVEHQQELRLRAANQQVGLMRRLIEHIDQQMASLRALQSGELTAGTTAAELQFSEACGVVLGHQRIGALRELKRLEHARDEQTRIFQQARRERETIETLRNQQRVEYERNARRREQQQLDELFLLRQTLLRQAHRKRS